MNATFLLVEDIKKVLAEQFSGMIYRQPTDGGRAAPENAEQKYRTPNIYIGHIPPKEAGEQGDEQPFVIIRPLDGEIIEDKDRKHTVKIGIFACIYSATDGAETEAGYQDIMNMMDVILIALSVQRYWGRNHWVNELPIRWALGLSNATNIYHAGLLQHPYYGAVVMANFYAAALGQKKPPEIDPNIKPRRG